MKNFPLSEIYWKKMAKWETCSLGNYDQLNPICLHLFVSNALGAKIYIGFSNFVSEFCDLIENRIRKWCNVRGPGDLCCLLYQESCFMISYSGREEGVGGMNTS